VCFGSDCLSYSASLVLIPLALYPAYRVTAADPSISAYWDAWRALPFWTNGPLWFLWQLLALNVIVAGLHWLAPNAIASLGRWSATAQAHFARYFIALLAVSALAYVPLAVAFTPWAWSDSGFLTVQFCRPLLYAVYFFAGVGVGTVGIERGVVSVDSILARHWARWLAAALASLFLWMGLTGLTMNGSAPIAVEVAANLSFVLACATGCFFLIAVSLHFATRHSRLLACPPMPTAFMRYAGVELDRRPRRAARSVRRAADRRPATSGRNVVAALRDALARPR